MKLLDSKTFDSSVVAGFLIGVSDYIYLNASNPFIAAFLFPIALIVILKTSSCLYTGKIGYVKPNLYSLKFVMTVLIGNIIGLTYLIILGNSTVYDPFVSAKISQNLWDSFGKAFICGCLMYLAVSYTESNTDFLLTIMCVAGFLIGKCEHSIADIGYLFASRTFSFRALLFIVIVILGNSLGSIITNALINKSSLK